MIRELVWMLQAARRVLRMAAETTYEREEDERRRHGAGGWQKSVAPPAAMDCPRGLPPKPV